MTTSIAKADAVAVLELPYVGGDTAMLVVDIPRCPLVRPVIG